jgi:uncharacterized membrane protein
MTQGLQQTAGAFFKGVLLKGFLFLIPIVVLLVIFSKAIELLAKLAHPLVASLGVHSVLGIGLSEIAAVLILLLVTICSGLIAQTATGASINNLLERLILRKMPGYTLLKSLDPSAGAMDSQPVVSTALANINGVSVLGFVMEEHANGLRTVFVPRAPTPAAGNIYFMREDQIQRLNVSVAVAVKSLARLGVGSKELFERALPTVAAAKSQIHTQGV